VSHRPLAKLEQDREDAWTIAQDLRVCAGHEDGFPIVWFELGASTTAPLFAGEQRVALYGLRVAAERTEDFADQHGEHGWTLAPNLCVVAGGKDGVAVVWFEMSGARTGPLSADDQAGVVDVLRAAMERAEELANEHNFAREEERDARALAAGIPRPPMTATVPRGR
jgi:hypothetical protein